MLRNLLLPVFLLSAAQSFAQASKITEKPSPAGTDYTKVGAPMPPMLLIAHHDTGVKPNAVAEVTKDAHDKRHAKKGNEGLKWEDKPVYYITNSSLDNGANLFVMLFNPTCPHCEDQTELLEKHITLFKKSKIVMVASTTTREYLPDFVRSFHVEDYYPQISIGSDSTDFIKNIFLYTLIPQINIYNGQRRLIKSFTGGVAMDSLKQYIE